MDFCDPDETYVGRDHKGSPTHISQAETRFMEVVQQMMDTFIVVRGNLIAEITRVSR